MHLSYDRPVDLDIDALAEAVRATGVTGFAGVFMTDALYLDFPETEDLSEEEMAVIDAVVAAQLAAPDWRDVRRTRAPKLREADWRLNRAIDDEDETLAAAIRRYRKALRDVTTQSDPANVTWPAQPW